MKLTTVLLLLLCAPAALAAPPRWLPAAAEQKLRTQPMQIWVPEFLPEGSRFQQVFAENNPGREWHSYTIKFACGPERWAVEATGGGIGDVGPPDASVEGKHPTLGPFSVFYRRHAGNAYGGNPFFVSPWTRMKNKGFIRVWGGPRMKMWEMKAVMESLRPL